VVTNYTEKISQMGHQMSSLVQENMYATSKYDLVLRQRDEKISKLEELNGRLEFKSQLANEQFITRFADLKENDSLQEKISDLEKCKYKLMNELGVRRSLIDK